ncbi:MAG: cryptochrome/photolyase family protein [Ktedonobacteraceae bacterium]
MGMQNIVSVWVLGDQLLLRHAAIEEAVERVGQDDVRVVFIESIARIRQLPYQKKKLVLLLSAMRHYAEQLRAQGYTVDYIHANSFGEGLQQHVRRHRSQALMTMAASEYDTRKWQQEELEQVVGVPVTVVRGSQFLVDDYNPIPHPQPGKRYVMENFYRDMRRHFGVLLEGDGTPVGGQWNYDKLNRESLPASFDAPAPPAFEPDEITREVIELIDEHEDGIGSASDFALPVTHEQAQALFDDFLSHRLADFGPYEDAMSTRESGLYHSQVSAYMNIGLLDPLEMIQAAEGVYRNGAASINSVEGFVRQVLGWREYMYWQYWQQMPDLRTANGWQGTRKMPLMFWNGRTEMNCIRHVAQRVLATGYNNHIERLMVVCNFCLLAGIIPAEVAEWFLSCYFDAYDWVVLPNVVGMGMNSDGGYTATKPYIASANYINKMSDYCSDCHFSPKQRTGPNACPFNFLYWNFLIKNEQKLRANPRLGPNVLSLRHIREGERTMITEEAQAFLNELEYYGAEDPQVRENV